MNTLKKKIIYFFNRFNSINYWENRYKLGGNSGDGSYGENAKFKAKILNEIIKTYNIKSVMEFGCGDGNNLGLYKIEKYTGLDVSREAIKICINNYKNDARKSFAYYEPDLFKSGGILADLTISFQVIFHITEDRIYKKYISDLFNMSNRFVLILAPDSNTLTDPAIHVRHRKFTDDIPNNFELIKKIPIPDHSNIRLKHHDFILFKKHIEI